MLAGKLFEYDVFELLATTAAAYSVSDNNDGIIFSARFEVGYRPDQVTTPIWADWYYVGTVAVTTGVVSGTLTIEIPPLGISVALGTAIVITGATLVPGSLVKITVSHLKGYARNAQLYTTWTAIAVTVDGVDHTPGAIAGAGSFTSPRMCPTGLPWNGVPPTLSTTISASAIPLSGPIPGSTSVGSASYSGSSSISGGYHVKLPSAGSFTAFPVTLQEFTGGSTGCPCEPGSLGLVGGSQTDAMSATSSFALTTSTTYRGRIPCCQCPNGATATICALYDVWDTNQDFRGSHSNVTALAGVPRGVRRMAPDYAAVVFRGGLPQTTSAYSDVVETWTWTNPGYNDAICGNVQVQTNPHPRETAFLATVLDAAHVIEDPFRYPVIAPYGENLRHQNAQATVAQLVQAGSCPAGGEGGGGGPINCITFNNAACQGIKSSSFPAQVEDLYANNQLTPGLYHNDPLTRYIDYWGAPQWNYAYWFPPDVLDGSPLHPWEWPVDGARVQPSTYWVKGRMQWRYHPALPPADATKKRCDLISAPLQQGGWQSFWQGFFGPAIFSGGSYVSNVICPWGISRFQAQQITIPASVTPTQTQTAIWAFANATAVFGASAVTLTPVAAPATVTATLTLGSFANAPYEVLALIKSLVLAFSGAGVASTAVNLIGIDGTSKLLATGPGTYAWPLGIADSEYAGSWGQDFGCGAIATDVGSDTSGSGISAAEMASNQNSFVYQLLLGFTAQKLQFVFTLSNPALPISLTYPTINLPTNPVYVQETGFTGIFISANSSGYRWGVWDYWNYGGASYQDPPAVYPFGQPSSVLDWLAGKRTIWQSLASTSGLDAEWGSMYDTVEAGARSDVANSTLAFVLISGGNPTGICVNTLSEIPPLIQFPRQARDANWAETGAWACYSYSHAKGPRDIVSAQVSANLFDASSGAQLTVPLAGLPAGWLGSRFDAAVTNSEDASGSTVKAAGTTYAHPSRWHGYSCVLFPSGCTAPYLHCSRDGELSLSCITGSGDIRFQWSPFTTPPFQNNTVITSSGGWSQQRHCTDSDGRIHIVAFHLNQGGGDPLASGTYYGWSDDSGASFNPVSGGAWSPQLILASSTLPDIKGDDQGGLLRITFVPDVGLTGPGTFSATYRGPADTAFGAPYTLVDDSSANLHSDGTGWGFHICAEESGRWALTMVKVGDTTPSVWYSSQDNGATWLRF